MARRDTMSNRALAFFDSHYQCAESVLMSAKERLGVRSSSIPRIATGFGAGIGRRGSVCGALSGAIMAIGLAYGREKPSQNRERAYALARRTFDRFKARFGSPFCMELIGVDLSTEAGRKKYNELNLHAERCTKLVSACAEMVERLLAHEKPNLPARGRTRARMRGRATVRMSRRTKPRTKQRMKTRAGARSRK